ncbi:terminal beta-(1-_2)-arabinofuranosyltransferase [Actinomycetospora chlora]|uniref:Terminal beta-(1->2)-arabinofuranosyltransferase n=1 Tax=Actinomycetospora chlora TaxID=663608 RepID=A0ABP9C3Y7_9PSEU
MLGGTVAVFAVLVWHRRWISDDGLIVLRTVRQLAIGNGPVFNAGERVEANTSTLWTALLALPGLLPGAALNWSAVVLGLVLSVAGLGLALDAARRLWGVPPRMLPCGALVVVALPPFWDFGTSGLETGLIVGWLGLVWWMLVRRLEARRRGAGGALWPLAVVLGLAPLVRPDLALVAIVVGVATVLLEAPRGWPRLAGAAGAAAVLPLLYEVFRAGYYGLLVPSTALAKEASSPRWEQGLSYLDDTVGTYVLWVPLAVLAVLGLTLLLASRDAVPDAALRRVTLAVAAAPPVAAALLALYVTRVGGDFMHARMLLPALFCLVLPVMAVPWRREVVPAVAVIAVWALVCLAGLRPDYGEELGPDFIANERMYYVNITGNPHPITTDDYLGHPVAPSGAATVAAAPPGTFVLRGPGDGWTLFREAPGTPSTIVWLNLGVTGELAPLDVRVHDAVGLTNPLAAHSTSLPNGRIGHDKDLPAYWDLADAGVTDPQWLDPAELDAARRAVSCPRTQEVLASVRDPLTAGRFWANLTGAWERTSYRYPTEPALAAGCPGG